MLTSSAAIELSGYSEWRFAKPTRRCRVTLLGGLRRKFYPHARSKRQHGKSGWTLRGHFTY